MVLASASGQSPSLGQVRVTSLGSDTLISAIRTSDQATHTSCQLPQEPFRLVILNPKQCLFSVAALHALWGVRWDEVNAATILLIGSFSQQDPKSKIVQWCSVSDWPCSQEAVFCPAFARRGWTGTVGGYRWGKQGADSWPREEEGSTQVLFQEGMLLGCLCEPSCSPSQVSLGFMENNQLCLMLTAEAVRCLQQS